MVFPGCQTRVLWRVPCFFNRQVFENAEAVFTIGKYMAQTLDRMYDSAKTSIGETVVIPNWADPELIYPIAKPENPFALKYDQVNSLTVLYSGTIGLKHNVNAMLQAAGQLNGKDKDMRFIFIGRGDGYNAILKEIENKKYGKHNLDFVFTRKRTCLFSFQW